METQKQIQNKVLGGEYKSSQNFHASDLILRDYLKRKISGKGFDYMNPKLSKTGGQLKLWKRRITEMKNSWEDS